MIGETATFDVFHHKEMLTFVFSNLMHSHDIGVS